GSAGTLRLWDAATGRELRSFVGHRGDVRCVAFSPDGKRLLSGGADGTVRLWDAATGRERGSPLRSEGGGGGARGAAPRGLLAGGTDGGEVHLWDAATGREAGHFDTDASITRLDFTPDGRMLAVNEGDKPGDAGVELRRLPGGAVVRRFGASLHDF